MKSIQCFLPGRTDNSEVRMFCLKNVIGNVVLFLPFGALLPLISKRFWTFGRVLMISAMLSIAIEVTQYVSRFFGVYRSVDVDDVLLNTIGALIGFCFVRISLATRQ